MCGLEGLAGAAAGEQLGLGGAGIVAAPARGHARSALGAAMSCRGPHGGAGRDGGGADAGDHQARSRSCARRPVAAAQHLGLIEDPFAQVVGVSSRDVLAEVPGEVGGPGRPSVCTATRRPSPWMASTAGGSAGR